MERTHLSTGKVEEGCEFKNLSFGGDQSCDFLWPPNNYTCSFCKRQFRSAQALGGHMNVHRRDRARLRQLPSWACDCPNTSPNPNPSSNLNPKFSPSSSSPSSKFFPYSYTHHSLLSPSLTSFSSRSHEEKKPIIKCPRRHTLSPQCGDLAKKGSMRGVLGVGEPKSTYAHKNELVVLKTREVISLDLEMRLKDPKEVLDLELRLGYL